MRRRSNDSETDGFEVDEEKSHSNKHHHHPLSASIKTTTSSTSSLSLPRNPSGTFTNPSNEKPKSPYGAFTHQIRKIVPEELACRAGCSGEKCKYCNSDWPAEDMAIQGVFSHWITQDILAMARPTTKAILEHKIIDQMKDLGIKSIFNLQMINEHKACGRSLETSGFSYDPIEFTKNDLYYYNFGFQDYSTVDMAKMVDMVKVLSFALQQGKVAVHCHAGLGRTGLFIACYFIYGFRMQAKDTVYYIRDKRRKSVQMNDQIEAIQKFEDFIRPLRIIYSIEPEHRAFTLNSFVIRQRYFLHGYESRTLKYIPKILYMCVRRLRQLLSGVKKEKKTDKSTFDDMDGTIDKLSTMYVERALNGAQKKLMKSSEMTLSIALALASHSFDRFVLNEMRKHQIDLNSEDLAYDQLMQERDPFVLVALMWHWLDHLQIPSLREQEIIVLANSARESVDGVIFDWNELDKCTFQTLNCVLDIYRDVLQHSSQVISHELEDDMVFHLISVLTHASVPRANDLSSTQSSQASIRTINNDTEGDDKERLIFHVHKLKKQHIRTLYHAIRTLIRGDTGSDAKATTTNGTDDDEEALLREYRRTVDFY